MAAVRILLPSVGVREWHRVLLDRLASSGHDVKVSVDDSVSHCRMLDAVCMLESSVFGRKRTGLATAISGPAPSADAGVADLEIDFAGRAVKADALPPVLTVSFHGSRDLTTAAAVLAKGSCPIVQLYLNGSCVGRAAPSTASRAFVSPGLDDVLARTITLISGFVDTYGRGTLRGAEEAEQNSPEVMSKPGLLAANYMFSALPRLGLRAADRLLYYAGHWRVGYRFVDGPGVVETGSLAGAPWTVLADGGDRFYADPFPFEWQGRYFVFVEELVHARAKGVISVSESDGDGHFDTPRKVLEEPFHLSYPQVFERDGDIWMIPESAAGRKLVLYRADRFPDVWVEQQVLVANRELFDATLLDHDGMLWLVASERDGAGDASDTMVVYFAERVEGPWHSHPMNPVLIDKAAARPGGGFARVGGEIVLPLQDGTICYGGGLGLSRLKHLDTERVEWSTPRPVDAAGHWPYPRIHTVNRAGRLETIDGLARMLRYGTLRRWRGEHRR